MRKGTLEAGIKGPKKGLSGIIERYRRHFLALSAAAAMSATACGDNGAHSMETDAADTGGTSGTGGSDGGTDTGTGGSTSDGGTDTGTGGNPCDLDTVMLAHKTYMPGETGSFAVNNVDPDNAIYEGLEFNMVSGDIVTQPSIVGIQRLAVSGYPVGASQIADFEGSRNVVVDADEPFDENCNLNFVEVDQDKLADPAKQPEMLSPQGFFATAIVTENGEIREESFELMADRTRFKLSQLKTASTDAIHGLGNRKPNAVASAFRDGQGHIVLNLAGTTDEGDGSDTVLEQLGVTVNGMQFEQVNGEPGKWRTMAPNNAVTLDASVHGLNDALTDDTTMAQVDVEETDPCIGVDCSGNGTCNGGVCECDAGYDGADCSTCDTPEYTESNANPGECVDDPCIPEACNDNGTCSMDNADQANCSCDQGYAGDACESCATGYVDSNVSPGTCVDDPCIPEACNDNGTCSMDNADQANCSCDQGYAGDACESCDTGYEGWPNCVLIPPNNAPVINSLTANPNPVDNYSPTTISFSVTDADNDDVNWSFTMTDQLQEFDELVNPSNGSCNGLTCSGVLPNGGGNVTITYNTGPAGDQTGTLDVDDGQDNDQDSVIVDVQ